MKLKRLKQAPVLIALSILVLVGLARLFQLDLFERVERITYDWRVRQALKFPSPIADNLGLVYIDDETIKAVKRGDAGLRFGLYWPRQVYGRLVNELSEQGAESVGFDVLFAELRRDQNVQVALANGDFVDADVYFGYEMQRASNVVLAATTESPPPGLFRTNAAALGEISTDKDPDGILRRAQAFHMYKRWHPILQQVEADPELEIDLSQTKFKPGKMILIRSNGEEFPVDVDAENNFNSVDFGAPPPGSKAKAFTEERVWHMGIVLAARRLKLDLEHADIDLAHGKIILRNTDGLERIIPVDREGFFYVNWSIPLTDKRLTLEPFHSLLYQNYQRLLGTNPTPRVDWKNKIAVVGSVAQGNDLTDRGATPLAKDVPLVSKHFNVANSIITGQFVRRTSLAEDLVLIFALGALTAFLTWQLRVITASVSVFVLVIAYIIAGTVAFVMFRVWIPLVLPIVGAVLVQHFSLVTYRVLVEQKERRRVKSIFSKVVAREVMDELLAAENLSLVGARREVTVLFADIRGFTELTDYTQERVAEYIRERKLPKDKADAFADEFASETLRTVNAYLSCVIDAAMAEQGTYDKLIGDCVMFFWNAPVDRDHHALSSVRAAIAAQQAIYKLNQARADENRQREVENRARESAGLMPKPPLATLTLGTGINTGVVTAGIMGMDTHQVNYTVFGREVNLASRLEGMSGRGRIFISESTYRHLQRDDATLAGTCIEREPMTPKGFAKPVKIYEVPWMEAGQTTEDFTTMLFAKPKSAPAAQ